MSAPPEALARWYDTCAFHSGLGAKNSPAPYQACGEKVLMSRARGIGSSVASAFRASAVIASTGPTSSSTQIPRPCVPRTSALSRSWKAMSSTLTVGMFCPRSECQVAPPSFEAWTPRSWPMTITFAFFGCSRSRFMLVSGRPAASDFHVAPKSSETKTYGL